MPNKTLSIVTGILATAAVFAFGMGFALYYTSPVLYVNQEVDIKVPVQEPPPAIVHKYAPKKYDM